MALSMYTASVPVFIRNLQNLAHVLRKGEAHAQAAGYAPDALLQARLAPDMLPLLRHVQIATDMAKNGACRLAGVELVPFADDESTFEALQARIDRAIALLRGLEAARFEGSESRDIAFETGQMKLAFNGHDYLLDFVLPNFYFHSTTTYAVLRASGVRLGKLDFMGATIER